VFHIFNPVEIALIGFWNYFCHCWVCEFGWFTGERGGSLVWWFVGFLGGGEGSSDAAIELLAEDMAYFSDIITGCLFPRKWTNRLIDM
jgi:hypothetical protein